MGGKRETVVALICRRGKRRKESERDKDKEEEWARERKRLCLTEVFGPSRPLQLISVNVKKVKCVYVLYSCRVVLGIVLQ
jgi:hypothetical protein